MGMTPAEAFYRTAPDSTFPVIKGGERPLLEAVRAGELVHVRCWQCDRQRDLSGKDLCAHHATWLERPTIDWARSLRCSQCGAKRFQVSFLHDSAAWGEFRVMAHNARIACLTRLKARLEEVGLDVRDVLHLVRDLPTAAELIEAGMGDIATAADVADGRRRKG